MNKKLRSRRRATGNYTTIKQPKVTFRVDNESNQTRNKITKVRTPLQSPLKGISALLKMKARIRMDRTVNSLHICAYGTYKAHPRNESPDTGWTDRKLPSLTRASQLRNNPNIIPSPRKVSSKHVSILSSLRKKEQRYQQSMKVARIASVQPNYRTHMWYFVSLKWEGRITWTVGALRLLLTSYIYAQVMKHSLHKFLETPTCLKQL